MKKYLSFIRCGFLNGCAYRSSFLTGMLANYIQVTVSYYVWKSIFNYQDMINGYTWELMCRYVFVSFLCNSTLSFGFEMDTAKRILKGDIILDLLRPVSFRSQLFFRMLGTACMEFPAAFFLIAVFYLAVNSISAMEPLRILLFILSLFLGMTIKFSIQYLFSLLCFYTDNAYGITKAREVLTNFFSGAIIPLAMFPKAVCHLVDCLPFQGIIYTPCSIFIGTFSLTESLCRMGLQLLWILLLWLAGTWFWKYASRVLTVYGG